MNTEISETDKKAISRIVLAGTISNVSTVIEHDLRRIQQALSDSILTHIILVESDSIDSTLEVVQKLAELDTRIEIISLGTLKNVIADRVERIRHCRQVYVERLREIQQLENLDYVVIADLDGMNSKIKRSDVNFSLKCGGWDVALSNQWFGYYDIFALRHPVWMPTNCFEDYHQARFDFMKMRKYRLGKLDPLLDYFFLDRLKVKYVYSRMLKISKSSQPIEVESGFGGFGIYKASVFVDCDYSIMSEQELGECEHISFSRQIRQKGYKIVIHPWLFNSYWNTYNVNKISMIRHLRALRRVIRDSVV